MESVTCLSSCSVVLRYLVSGVGAIHGEFPLRRNLFHKLFKCGFEKMGNVKNRSVN